MKKILMVLVLLSLIIWMAIYWFLHLDFIGTKDPKVVEENLKRDKAILLRAEYRNGTNYCKIDLDSIQIWIDVGDAKESLMSFEGYTISGDTIIFENLDRYFNKGLNTNKFLVKNNKIFFKLNKAHQYDTIQAMEISGSRIKFP